MPPKKTVQKTTEKVGEKRQTRRWTPEENIQFLEYLAETVIQGHKIEKPTALLYYKRLIDSTNISNCNPDLVKNKVRNFQTTYIAAVNWQKNTGQGIKETDGEETLKAVLNKRYPYLTLMEQVWGEKVNVHPPAVAESTSEASDINRNELADDHETDNPEGDDWIALETVTLNEAGDIILPGNEQLETEGVSNASKTLLARLNKVTTSKTAYEEILQHREESLMLKLQIQEEHIQLEKQRFKDNVELERDKLEFEKLKWNAEMDFKEKELAVKKLQIEAEVRLKELEIERLKLTRPSD